ncbi:MAG TPA: glycosyltransferase family 4 protein [Allosphingosinicella sp.]|nr:glycosyltransferase family 4 protein [Allosphingosinicella sp.]
MKVCHVFAATEGGRWVYEQLDALKRDHGCEVVALLGGDEGPTVDMCRRAGIRTESFDFRLAGRRDLLTFPLRIVRLARWFRRERFDVVQSHILPSTMFARPAAWLADVPVRFTMSTSPYYLQAPSIRWVEARTAFMETGVIPSCRVTTRLYREAGVAERLIMPCLYYGPHEAGFDPAGAIPEGLRAEIGVPEDTPLVGSIAVFYARCPDSSFVPPDTRGRFIKGHCDLIRAMHHVRREFPTARLVMVGRGWGPRGHETEEELAAFVRDEGLEEIVYFAGWRGSTPAVLVDLDVSVQASVNENLGGTVESLLMARPTVATRVGGMVDAVVDGETGILVNPEDPEDLARGICELLRDPARGAALGKAGRAHMLSGFTLTTTVPRLFGLYRRQRAEARGAWRLSASARRLALAALLAAPIFGRMLLWDVYMLNAVPARWRRLRARFARPAPGRV